MKMSSPISAQQRSVQESSRQFETRMRNMVSLLKSADSPFFYKRVTKSMATEVVKGPFAYSLEFPFGFLRKHAKKFVIDVTFVMKDTERTWPIKLTVRAFKNANSRVFAYGDGGWKKFVTENQIKVGDILIFNLLRLSQFQVVIGRAPVEVHPDDHGDDNEGEVKHYSKSSAKWFRNASPEWNAEQAPVSCRGCKLAPPCPRFLVTIGPSSHLQHFSLAVPGRFWELHGNMLERDDLQLRGPNKAICIVEAKRNYDEEEKKLCVRLESGKLRYRCWHEAERCSRLHQFGCDSPENSCCHRYCEFFRQEFGPPKRSNKVVIIARQLKLGQSICSPSCHEQLLRKRRSRGFS